MSDWSNNDYEPTPEEVEDAFFPLTEAPRGAHGTIEFIASMERYIWSCEDVVWGYREVLADGRVRFFWEKM